MLYERGEASQRELAEKYGVSRQAIQAGLAERGAVMGIRIDEVVSEAKDASEKARRQRIEDVTSMKQRYIQYNDLLAKMVIKKISEASKVGGMGLAALNAELLTLKTASYVFQKTRQEQFDLYDVSALDGDGDEMPELSVSTYTDEELNQIQAANEEAYNEHLLGDDGDDDEPGV